MSSSTSMRRSTSGTWPGPVPAAIVREPASAYEDVPEPTAYARPRCSRISSNSRLDRPPPRTWFVTSSASRSASSRARPRKPRATWACSLRRRSTTTGWSSASGATRAGAGAGGAAGKRRATSATTASWSTSPATATTIADGRYQRPKNSRTSSGVMASTDAALPAVSRPRGWSGNSASASRRWTTSSGRSSSMASSSRMTWRSLSMSPSRSAGSDEHVTEELDDERQVLGRNPAVVRGVLLCREGVDVAADPVDRRGDVARAALLGALEQQVLEEVRDARQLVGLVPRPDADPDAGGHRERRGDALGHHPQPRGELRDVGVGLAGILLDGSGHQRGGGGRMRLSGAGGAGDHRRGGHRRPMGRRPARDRGRRRPRGPRRRRSPRRRRRPGSSTTTSRDAR